MDFYYSTMTLTMTLQEVVLCVARLSCVGLDVPLNCIAVFLPANISKNNIGQHFLIEVNDLIFLQAKRGGGGGGGGKESFNAIYL